MIHKRRYKNYYFACIFKANAYFNEEKNTVKKVYSDSDSDRIKIIGLFRKVDLGERFSNLPKKNSDNPDLLKFWYYFFRKTLDSEKIFAIVF